MSWHHIFLLLGVLSLAVVASPTAAQTPAHVEIPLQAEHEWFIVPVVANASDTLRFILDTGASVSAVTRSTAERLRLRKGGAVTAQGASGAQRVPTTSIGSLGLGHLESSRVQVLILEDRTLTPFGGRRDGYEPYDGVLGVDILSLFDVLIDPVSGLLHLYQAGEAPEPELMADLAEPLAMRRIATVIVGHDVEVEGVTLPAVLDTGSRRIVLNHAAAAAAGVEPTADAARAVESPGVGTRPIELHASRVEDLSVGPTSFGELPITVGDLPVFQLAGFDRGPAVLLGSPAVRRCAVFLSYRHNQIRYCRAPGD